MTQNVSLLLFFRSIKARTIPPSRLSFAPPCRRLVAAAGTMAGLRTLTSMLDLSAYTAVKQPVRSPCPRDQIAMIQIGLDRSLSQDIAASDVRQEEQGDISLGWQDKSRKVRPVGWLGNVSNFSHAPNLAKNWYTLPILPGRCPSSVFDTLWRAR